MLSRFLQDVRFALRGFRRNVGTTLVTVLVLALGIGANTAIFSIVDAVVLRPLPFPDANELVAVPDGLMYLDFLDIRSQARSFRNLAAYRLDQVLMAGQEQPETVNAVDSSAELFSVLGVQASLGRTFAAGEDQPGRRRVAVVSDGFWRRHLAAEPGAIGRTVVLDRENVTVIGVMPPGFRFPLDQDSGDLWISQGEQWRDQRQWRGYRAFRSIGRLNAGMDLRAAQAEVSTIATRLAQLHPRENAGRTISIVPYDGTVKTGRLPFLILLAAVGVVLLIACANVANLQLVLARSRHRELAIRAALGAGRGRILTQFLTESLVLAAVAGALGLAAAALSLDLLISLLPRDVPRVTAIALDGPVLLYALVAALGTAVIVGVAPALQIFRTNLIGSLKNSDRGNTTGRAATSSMLLVYEIALAVVLLAAAGLLVRSYAHVAQVDPGFNPRSLLIVRLQLPGGSRQWFFQQFLPRAHALPGVSGATFAREMPYGRVFNSWNFALEDRPPPPPDNPWWANARGVGERYFETLGIPVLEGRSFRPEDMSAAGPAKVVVINETFARRYWPHGSPIGHRIVAYERDVRIIGVVADTRGTCDQAGCAGAGAGRLDRPPLPEVYVPNNGFDQSYLAVRASGSATAPLVSSLRALVRTLSPNAVLTEVGTMEQAIDESLDQRRLVMWLLTAFAALAMILAALGIYGVTSHTVIQRTREIGVRMALGASASEVRMMVVARAMRVCLLGLGIGVIAALALARLLSSQLFGVSPNDPVTFGGMAALFLAVSLAGSLVPALRATRIDPMVALRTD